MAEPVGKVRVGVEADDKGWQDSVGSVGGKMAAAFGPFGETAWKTFSNIGKAAAGGSEQGLVSAAQGVGKNTGGAFTVGVAAAIGVAAIGAALFKVGSEFNSAYNDVAKTTGKTGAELDKLKDTFKNVASNTGASFKDIATAVGELSTRTGASGKDLETLSLQMLKFSKVTGTDLSSNIKSVTRLMGDWDISVGDAGIAMDKLYVLSTKTGIGVDKLSDQVTKFGSPMRQLGFSFEETASYLAKFEKEGVNAELVMGSFRIAVGKLAKAGETDLPKALRASINEIQNMESGGMAAAKAAELFGARAGPDMAAAIREGRLNVEDLVDALGNAEGAINTTAKETATWQGKMAKLGNKIKVAFEPLAMTVFDSVTDAFDKMMPLIESGLKTIQPLIVAAGDAFGFIGDNIAWVAPLAGAILAAAAAWKIFNVVMALSKAIMATHPVGLIVMAVAALVVGVIALYKNWKPFADVVDATGRGFVTAGKAIADFVAAAYRLVSAFVEMKAVQVIIDGLLTKFRGMYTFITQAVTAIVRLFKGDFSGAFDAAKNALGGLVDYFIGFPLTIARALLPLAGTIGSAILDALKSAGSAIVDFMTSLPGLIVDALKALPGLLLEVFTTAIALVIAGIILYFYGLYKLWTEVVPTIIGKLANLGIELVKAFAGGITALVQAIPGALSAVIRLFADLPSTIARALASLAGTLASIGAGAVGSMVGALASLPGHLWNIGSNAIHTMASAISGAIGAVIGVVANIPATLIWIINTLPGAFFDAGRNIIQGLINGINSMIGFVGDAVTKVVDKAKSFLPFSPAKQGPLSGRGDFKYAGIKLMQQLATGITSNVGAIESAMNQATDAIAVMPSTIGVNAQGTFAGGTQGSAGGDNYTLNIYPQQLDEVGVLAAFHRLEIIGAIR